MVHESLPRKFRKSQLNGRIVRTQRSEQAVHLESLFQARFQPKNNCHVSLRYPTWILSAKNRKHDWYWRKKTHITADSRNLFISAEASEPGKGKGWLRLGFLSYLFLRQNFSNKFKTVLVIHCFVMDFAKIYQLVATNILLFHIILWVRNPGVAYLGGCGSGSLMRLHQAVGWGCSLLSCWRDSASPQLLAEGLRFSPYVSLHSLPKWWHDN